MSTIRVDNFGPSAGGTTYSARGIAKAWVNFNGTGTIAARDSENVSSLTDNGTGDYTVNFSNAFGAGDYAIGGSTVGNTSSYTQIATGVVAPATGSIRITTGRFDTTLGNITDINYVHVICHGDLA